MSLIQERLAAPEQPRVTTARGMNAKAAKPNSEDMIQKADSNFEDAAQGEKFQDFLGGVFR